MKIGLPLAVPDAPPAAFLDERIPEPGVSLARTDG